VKILLLGALLTAAIASASDSPILWRDSGPVESLDLASGPGGPDGAPQPPFVFEKEETSGTSAKVLVKDARGKKWMAKFGPEVKAETFGSRMAWAAGYMVEPTYYVAEGKIENVGKLSRAAPFIDTKNGGAFKDSRFQLRDKAYEFIPNKWSLDEKSIKGTKELAGLKLLAMLVANWDVKPANMAVIGYEGQRYFSITDWGASMGQSGEIGAHSKWDCPAFAKQSDHFVDGVSNGFVSFNYTGKSADMVGSNIRVSDVKWFMDRMGKLTDQQIQAGLVASGATPEEVPCFPQALRKRLGQLATVASTAGMSPDSASKTTTTTTTTSTTPKQ
jgi:hypothetical protein